MQLMAHSKYPIYALQFHPEVTHTKEGSIILENFVFKICNCKAKWKMAWKRWKLIKN